MAWKYNFKFSDFELVIDDMSNLKDAVIKMFDNVRVTKSLLAGDQLLSISVTNKDKTVEVSESVVTAIVTFYRKICTRL